MPTLDLQTRHLQLLLQVLDRRAPDAEIWAYGSRVTGTAHEGSDLDLVLRNPTRLGQPMRQLQRLREALGESNRWTFWIGRGRRKTFGGGLCKFTSLCACPLPPRAQRSNEGPERQKTLSDGRKSGFGRVASPWRPRTARRAAPTSDGDCFVKI